MSLNLKNSLIVLGLLLVAVNVVMSKSLAYFCCKKNSEYVTIYRFLFVLF